MKKKQIIYFAIFVFAFVFSISCKKETKEVVTPLIPTISVSIEGSPNYYPGETIKFKIVAESTTSKLKSLKINGLTPNLGTISTLPAGQWNETTSSFETGNSKLTIYFDYVINANLPGGTTIYLNFKVTDENEMLNTTDANIICVSNTPSLNPPVIIPQLITPVSEITPGSTVRFKLEVATNNGGLSGINIQSAGLETGTVITPITPADAYVNGQFKENLVSATLYVDVVVKADIPLGTTIPIKFYIVDKAGKTGSANFDLTTVAITGILKRNTITLGAQNSTIGSFAASFSGIVYTTPNATANCSSIDMIYYNGNTNAETIFSPSDYIIQTITWGGNINWSFWITKNDTRFIQVADSDFDNATYSSVETFTPTLTLANHLVIGYVFAFKTTNNRYGIFKVIALTAGDNGSVTISVKIQDHFKK